MSDLPPNRPLPSAWEKQPDGEKKAPSANWVKTIAWRIAKYIGIFVAVVAASKLLGVWAIILAIALPGAYLLFTSNDGSQPKSANCPTCSGVVAIGAAACPHCGMSKPLPKVATRKHYGIALLFLALLISGYSPNHSGNDSQAESPKSDTPQLRAWATSLIVGSGYMCSTIDAMGHLFFENGYYVKCNGFRYTYNLIDRGRGWSVKPD